MPRVFVTDGHWRKTLAVVRSLGKQGITVTVGESARIATALFSTYASRRVVYPSVRQHPDAFLSFLHRELAKTNYDLVIPMEEETLLLLSQHRDAFAPVARFPLPPHEIILKARDKGWLLQHAAGQGMPIPRTVYCTEETDLNEVMDTIPPPWVIKPRVSSGSFGIAYVERKGDLPEAYRKVHRQFPFPVIQERIPAAGEAFGCSALMDREGRVKACFVHRRLREYPITGGPSTLRESVSHPQIEELGIRLLQSLHWHGVAMVEFKVDPRDNQPKLMELNPRFWGSLALAIHAGVDFPYLLYRMAMGEDVQPVRDYAKGVRCRWLLPGDILHFLTNPRRFHMKPNFFRVRGIYDDILSWDDPFPTIGTFLTLFSLPWNKDLRRFLKPR
jgi:predicted ATP-grasp superfamily ATP-dependent carboligase